MSAKRQTVEKQVKRAIEELSPITCEALLCPSAQHERFLRAYGKAFHEATLDVYLRCVVGEEPWFVKGSKDGMRSKLQAKGWSQREATSIYKTAKAAQDSAVESAKLGLQRMQEELEVVKRRLKRARTSRRHGLARRRSRLRARIKRLETLLAQDGVRVCFGGQKALRATREWEANGYETQQDAHDVWVRRRTGMIYVEGDREPVGANMSLQVELSAEGEGEGDQLRMRVPRFLADLVDGAKEIVIAARGFAEKQGREALKDALVRDPKVRAARIAQWEAASQRAAEWKARVAAGEQGPPERSVAQKKPQQTCASPVTVRISWNEDKQAWYVGATVARPRKASRKGRWKAVLATDINPDHLAWGLLNRHGNPTRYGRIELDLTGSEEQIQASVGNAIRELVLLAKALEDELGGPVCIAHERLDFKRARAGLRYRGAKLAHLLSSFAYRQILNTLTHRAAREGITTRAVSPAWTSVLGQANYAAMLGISVDQAAAVVIGRRALGLGTRIRPGVIKRLLADHGKMKGAALATTLDGVSPGADTTAPRHNGESSPCAPAARTGTLDQHCGKQDSQARLRELARGLGPRRTTWDKDGLATRASACSIGASTTRPPSSPAAHQRQAAQKLTSALNRSSAAKDTTTSVQAPSYDGGCQPPPITR